MQFNPEAMTYEVPKTADFPDGVINPYIEDKTRKMIMLQEFWKKSRITNYGLDHDVDLFAIEVIILDPEDHCYSAFISYPGYHYSYNATDFKPGQPNCIDVTKVYEDIFTTEDTQWFKGMSPDNKFWTWFENEEVKTEDSKLIHFMGIESTSEVFDGLYTMFSNIDAINKLIS